MARTYTFTLDTAGRHYTPEDAARLSAIGITCTAKEPQRDRRYIDGLTFEKVCYRERNVPPVTVSFETLEELLSFVDTHGGIILRRDVNQEPDHAGSILIYDDYIE